jgi:hypothetical protein
VQEASQSLHEKPPAKAIAAAIMRRTIADNFGNAGGQGDVNNDNIVDDADLLIVLFNFGAGC